MDNALRDTFLTAGVEYERYRPSFPPAMLDWLLPDGVSDLLDLGAGTGKLTELLLDHADSVTAADASAAMLAELSRKLPSVPVLVCRAEELPLPDESLDAVTVAQAFHWFDRERASIQIARVLRPGGVLGLIWNRPAHGSEWDAACYEIAHPGVEVGAPPQYDLPGFETPVTRDFTWVEPLSRDHYLARWLTVSSFMAAEPAERERMIDAVHHVLDTHPETAGQDTLRLQHSTHAVRLVRSP